MSNSRKNLIKWILALQSRHYSQGQRVLCKKTGEGFRYCCLGVAALTLGYEFKRNPYDVYDLVWETLDTISNYRVVVSLSERMRNALGIDLDTVMGLVSLNDFKSAEFKEIAKFLIDKYNVTEVELNEERSSFEVNVESSENKEESSACPT